MMANSIDAAPVFGLNPSSELFESVRLAAARSQPAAVGYLANSEPSAARNQPPPSVGVVPLLHHSAVGASENRSSLNALGASRGADKLMNVSNGHSSGVGMGDDAAVAYLRDAAERDKRMAERIQALESRALNYMQHSAPQLSQGLQEQFYADLSASILRIQTAAHTRHLAEQARMTQAYEAETVSAVDQLLARMRDAHAREVDRVRTAALTSRHARLEAARQTEAVEAEAALAQLSRQLELDTQAQENRLRELYQRTHASAVAELRARLEAEANRRLEQARGQLVAAEAKHRASVELEAEQQMAGKMAKLESEFTERKERIEEEVQQRYREQLERKEKAVAAELRSFKTAKLKQMESQLQTEFAQQQRQHRARCAAEMRAAADETRDRLLAERRRTLRDSEHALRQEHAREIADLERAHAEQTAQALNAQLNRLREEHGQLREQLLKRLQDDAQATLAATVTAAVSQCTRETDEQLTALRLQLKEKADADMTMLKQRQAEDLRNALDQTERSFHAEHQEWLKRMTAAHDLDKAQAVSKLRAEMDALKERALADLRQRFQRDKIELQLKIKTDCETERARDDAALHTKLQTLASLATDLSKGSGASTKGVSPQQLERIDPELAKWVERLRSERDLRERTQLLAARLEELFRENLELRTALAAGAAASAANTATDAVHGAPTKGTSDQKGECLACRKLLAANTRLLLRLGKPLTTSAEKHKPLEQTQRSVMAPAVVAASASAPYLSASSPPRQAVPQNDDQRSDSEVEETTVRASTPRGQVILTVRSPR